MQSRSKMFKPAVQTCNPYKEFWDYLEWLARRHYPEPMYIWNSKFGKYAIVSIPKVSKSKLYFPAKDEDEIYILRPRR